jgi:hypothetical protein
MNSDLTPAQNVSTTDNPQASNGSGSDGTSDQLQKSATQDVLNHSQSLQVASNGQPFDAGTQKHTSSFGMISVIVIIALVILIGVKVSWSYFKTRSSLSEAEKEIAVPVVPVKLTIKSQKKPKGKKKPSRSKRH